MPFHTETWGMSVRATLCLTEKENYVLLYGVSEGEKNASDGCLSSDYLDELCG